MRHPLFSIAHTHTHTYTHKVKSSSIICQCEAQFNSWRCFHRSCRWRTIVDCEMSNSPDTLRMLLIGLELGVKIDNFRPTCHYLIIEDLAVCWKFCEVSSHCIMINYASTFFIKRFFFFFFFFLLPWQAWKSSISKSVWMKLLHFHVFSFQITLRVKQCTKCQRTI